MDRFPMERIVWTEFQRPVTQLVGGRQGLYPDWVLSACKIVMEMRAQGVDSETAWARAYALKEERW